MRKPLSLLMLTVCSLTLASGCQMLKAGADAASPFMPAGARLQKHRLERAADHAADSAENMQEAAEQDTQSGLLPSTSDAGSTEPASGGIIETASSFFGDSSQEQHGFSVDKAAQETLNQPGMQRMVGQTLVTKLRSDSLGKLKETSVAKARGALRDERDITVNRDAFIAIRNYAAERVDGFSTKQLNHATAIAIVHAHQTQTAGVR